MPRLPRDPLATRNRGAAKLRSVHAAGPTATTRRRTRGAAVALGTLALTGAVTGTTAVMRANSSPTVSVGRLAITLTAQDGFKLDTCANDNITSSSTTGADNETVSGNTSSTNNENTPMVNLYAEDLEIPFSVSYEPPPGEEATIILESRPLHAIGDTSPISQREYDAFSNQQATTNDVYYDLGYNGAFEYELTPNDLVLTKSSWQLYYDDLNSDNQQLLRDYRATMFDDGIGSALADDGNGIYGIDVPLPDPPVLNPFSGPVIRNYPPGDIQLVEFDPSPEGN